MRSRRDVLRRGLVAGALTSAALPARAALAAAASDVALLASAGRLETTLEAAYGRLADSSLLIADLRATAKRFRGQQAEHVTALRALGVSVPLAADARLLVPLGRASTQEQMIGAVIALELQAVGAYERATKGLRDARFLQTAVQIMANAGQHLAILRDALGRDPVPNAFEDGTGKRL
jgi:hypothetical protein